MPYYTFRIQELNLLQVTQEGQRKPARLFNNRDLEKLFGSFNTVKFFLTKRAPARSHRQSLRRPRRVGRP